MAKNEEKLLAEFESKMKRLMLYCDLLKAENVRLKREITEQESAMKQITETNEQLKREYANLKFAKALTSDNQPEMQLAKDRLKKLVQDVDKCITILKS